MSSPAFVLRFRRQDEQNLVFEEEEVEAPEAEELEDEENIRWTIRGVTAVTQSAYQADSLYMFTVCSWQKNIDRHLFILKP